MPIRRSKRLSYFDAFFFSLMVGAGETYLPAYALSVGMSETLSGLFATVPLFAGALIQLFTPLFIPYAKSIKRWVVVTTALQALAFLPLIYFSFDEKINFLLLFLIAAIYWGAGFAAGPSWNFWMGHLVSDKESPHFFSRRLYISQAGVLIGLVGGGYALHYKIAIGPFTSVFSLIFLVAFLSRASSSLILSMKHYQHDWTPLAFGQPLREAFQMFRNSREYLTFFGFLFLFFFTINISAPFVVPYFLAQLHLTYNEFMLGIGAFIGTKLLTQTRAHRVVEGWGPKLTFFIGAIGMAPLPAFWGVSDHILFVIFLQSLSGFFWGLFEVAMSVIFFNQLKHEDKIPLLTLYNFFNALAIIGGSLMGAQLLHSFGETREAYYYIFIFGGFMRTLVTVVYGQVSKNKPILIRDK